MSWKSRSAFLRPHHRRWSLRLLRNETRREPAPRSGRNATVPVQSEIDPEHTALTLAAAEELRNHVQHEPSNVIRVPSWALIAVGTALSGGPRRSQRTDLSLQEPNTVPITPGRGPARMPPIRQAADEADGADGDARK
jgi:hypothetical protein